MPTVAPTPFGAHLKALRETAGHTQEELAAIAGLSVHAVSALERGERRRPHGDTVRALGAALDLAGAAREAFVASARPPAEIDDDAGATTPPHPLTPLVGREYDVATLTAWLAAGATRLITLTGPGGVGKTRLVLELARRTATEGSARVVFVPLAAVQRQEFVAPAIADALGLGDITPAALPARVRVASGGRPWLLVLDNFEHVIAAAPLITELLSTAPSLRVLVTSRAALHVRGEREYLVAPLALEDGRDAVVSTSSPAMRLFVARVKDVLPDFRLTEENTPVVAAICRRLDALPLALELAAPWLKVLSVEALCDRLARDVLPEVAAPRDLPERQHTMTATVAWSYQLLSAPEQRALRRFAVVPGPFPIDAAASILAGSSPAPDEAGAILAVAGLIDKSLVVRLDSSAAPTCPLYQMLETVRAYAAHEIGSDDERDDAMEGLVRYCAGESALAASGLAGPAQVRWLDRVREDLDSYRAALGWLLDRGRAAEAAEIAWQLLFFWLIRGHASEGRRWYKAALDTGPLPAPLEAAALMGAATMAYAQGDLAQAHAEVTRALALAPDSHPDLVVQAQNLCGHIDLALGRVAAAGERFTQSIEGFRAGRIGWGVGHASCGLAWVALTQDDVDLAERRLDDAAQELRDVGPWFFSLMRYLRAIVAVRRGRADEALAWVRDSLVDVRALQDTFAFVYALVPLTIAAAARRDDAWAARIAGARDTVVNATGATVADVSVRPLLDTAEREVRARLGPEEWATAYAAGLDTSIDTLLADIDRALRGGAPTRPR